MSDGAEHEAGGTDTSDAAGSPLAEAVLGTAVVVLGGFILWHIAGLDVGPSYSRIGPRIFPLLVAVGLLLIGAGLIVGAALRVETEALPRIDFAALLWVAGGLLAMLLLLERAGFVPAAAALFASAARGFGGQRTLLALGIGVVLALLCQFGFSYGLGINLPWGILSGLR